MNLDNQVHQAVEVARSERPLDCVTAGEGHAERMYSAAENILEKALAAKDLRMALMAIKSAVSVMGEARAYMQLRGELGGELGKRQQSVVFPDAKIVVTMVDNPLALPAPPSKLGGNR